LLERIDDYLLTCFQKESPPRIAELARTLGQAQVRFVETFFRAMGRTPSAYLKDRQVAAASLLLLKTNTEVNRIGYAAGFGTRRTFFREFLKRTGMTPANYRKHAGKCP
jgi:AraC-like DNA-binding protein